MNSTELHRLVAVLCARIKTSSDTLQQTEFQLAASQPDGVSLPPVKEHDAPRVRTQRHVTVKFDVPIGSAYEADSAAWLLTLLQAAQEGDLVLEVEGVPLDVIEVLRKAHPKLKISHSLGVVIRASSSDAVTAVRDAIAWAREHRIVLGVRLQDGEGADEAVFRELTVQLLRATDAVYPIIATVNPKQQAWAHVVGMTLGVLPQAWELRMPRGVLPELQRLIIGRGQRLRQQLTLNPGQRATAAAFASRLLDPRVDVEELGSIDGPTGPLEERVSVREGSGTPSA